MSLLHVFLLLGAVLGVAPAARAELPQSEQSSATRPTVARASEGALRPEPPLLVRLSPTAEQRDQARARMLEQRLVRLISALPEVERAEVDIDQHAASDPLDRPASTPHVAVVVAVGPNWSPRQTRASIQHIVSAVLPALAPSDLTVVERTRQPDHTKAATSAHSLVQIGPFLVHPRSASDLRLGLAGLLATNALLAGILLWRTRLVRTRTARRTES